MENRDKELLLKFINQESQIKERWQVVEWFEQEKKRFEDEKQNLLEKCEKLDREYTEKSQLLEEMLEQLGTLEQSFRELERKEIESKEKYKERETQSNQLLSQNMELSSQVKALQKEQKELKIAVQSLKAEYIVRQNALKDIKDRRDLLLESTVHSSVQEAMPVHRVEVMGKGGEVKRAIPAKNYYEEIIVSYQSDESRSERELHDELERLQARVIDLELENANLSIENRELRGEMTRASGSATNNVAMRRAEKDEAERGEQASNDAPKKPKKKKEKAQNMGAREDSLTKAKPEPEIEDKIAHLGQVVETNDFKEGEDNELSEDLGLEDFGGDSLKKPLLEDMRIIVPTHSNKDNAR
ncbi:MAG: hypothetical protein K2N70_07290 [Helicobacter sp.]|nr:hypothetical protein [Helicobacter sp.]